jgi:predicted anti-sigma-YlaC factor YlaD
MNCRELTSFIADYLDGGLHPTVHRAFEDHLALCPNCRQYLMDYERTIQLTRRMLAQPDQSIPGDVPAALVSAILAARRRGHP